MRPGSPRRSGCARSRSLDENRAAYHAGAAIASNYLVTLRQAAGSLLEAAGAPPEALDPLMRRTIENGFELTGPIQRGDWETVERHLEAIQADRPELEAMYRVARRRHGGRRMRVCRTIAEIRTALEPCRDGTIGLVPTMGALHAGHLVAPRGGPGRVLDRRDEPVRQPRPVRRSRRDLDGYPRDEEHDLAAAAEAGVDLVFAPAVDEMYPPGFQTWVDVTELGAVLEGEHRPGHFRGVATVCLKLFTIVGPDIAYFGQKDAQQVAVLRRLIADLALELELRDLPTVRDDRRPRALLPQPAPLRRPSASGPSRCRGRSRPATPTARGSCSTGSRSTTSRSPRSTLPSSPPPSASAPPA